MPYTKKKKKNRITIGLLLDNLYDDYSANIWKGAVDYTKEKNVNLICFTGGSLHSPDQFYSQRNVIYDLVNDKYLDGIVAISGSIGNHINLTDLNRFYSGFAPLPIVSIGGQIDNGPYIIVENDKGMSDLVDHLIEVHNYKRIAFIKGPDVNLDALARFNAYKKSLENHGIPYDPQLVTPGTFDLWSGKEAIRLLLDDRGIGFDAIVAANDYMALSIINELKSWGIIVPEDVAVTGFDDIKESGGIIPSLTTVHQPLNEMGRVGLQTILSILNGEEVQTRITLPTKFIVRRSCGCFSHTRISPPVNDQDEHDGKTGRKNIKGVLIPKVLEALKAGSIGFSDEELLASWSVKLYQSFIEAKKHLSEEKFIVTLEKVITEGLSRGLGVSSWYGVISTMFGFLLIHFKTKKDIVWLDNLWKEALIFIGETAERIQTLYRSIAEQQNIALNKINRSLITSFNKTVLKNIIAEEFPRLGINSCYVSLYKNYTKSRKYSKLILWYNKRKTVKPDPGANRFISRYLIPGGIKRISARYSFVVMPLFFKREQIGFVLFEIGPTEAKIYENLASQLSSSLKGARLVSNRKRLEKEIIEISGREQMRIGQDLHDGLGQMLTGIAYLCKALEGQLSEKELKEAESAGEISDLINQTIAQTRSLARGLFPVELDQNGLVSAFEELSQNIFSQLKIPCYFECPQEVLIKDNSCALHLYRIAQEACNNAVRHANTKTITIRLFEEEGSINLIVRDDGMGIPELFRQTKGLGLRIMRYRADMIGARLIVKKNIEGGTSVICIVKNPGDIKMRHKK